MTTTTDKLESLPLPPGDRGLPFIGETIGFFTDPEFNTKLPKPIKIQNSILNAIASILIVLRPNKQPTNRKALAIFLLVEA